MDKLQITGGRALEGEVRADPLGKSGHGSGFDIDGAPPGGDEGRGVGRRCGGGVHVGPGIIA